MASGSGSDAAEPAEPRAAPGTSRTQEEIELQVTRRQLQCMRFALIAKCDTTMAHTFLSENDWQVEVSWSGSPPRFSPGGRGAPSKPSILVPLLFRKR